MVKPKSSPSFQKKIKIKMKSLFKGSFEDTREEGGLEWGAAFFRA